MALLGIHDVIKRITTEHLLINLGDRDLTNPEGVGIDLRLGSIHTITEGGAFIEADGPAGLGRRKGVQTKELARYDDSSETQAEIRIEPGVYYLVTTIEALNTPLDLMPQIFPRSSLFRAGLLLLTTKGDPGYKGPLTFGLTNLSPFPVTLQMGARICNIVFMKIEGESVAYRGQHQGGRVTAQDIEQQV